MRSTCLSRLLSLTMTIAAGCSASPPVPGTMDYAGSSGVLTGIEGAGLAETWKATVEAMQGLSLNPLERERDGFSGLVVGETAGGRSIRVSLKRLSDAATELKIRILFTRDRAMSEQILLEIRKHLAKA